MEETKKRLNHRRCRKGKGGDEFYPLVLFTLSFSDIVVIAFICWLHRL